MNIIYEYGWIGTGRKARRNKITGEVTFLLWEKGEQGHKEDFYYKVGDGWAETFSLEKAHGIGE